MISCCIFALSTKIESYCVVSMFIMDVSQPVMEASTITGSYYYVRRLARGTSLAIIDRYDHH